MRIRGRNKEVPVPLDQCHNIVGNRSIPGPGKSGGRCRFSSTFRPYECDTDSPIATALACRQVTPRKRRSSPRTGPKMYVAASSTEEWLGQEAQSLVPCSIHPKLHPIEIDEMEESLSRSSQDSQRRSSRRGRIGARVNY